MWRVAVQEAAGLGQGLVRADGEFRRGIRLPVALLPGQNLPQQLTRSLRSWAGSLPDADCLAYSLREAVSTRVNQVGKERQLTVTPCAASLFGALCSAVQHHKCL